MSPQRPAEDVLEQLGLSPKEIKVYVTLLKEGPSSVRQMAAATGINRGTVYDSLKNLQAMRLARFYNKETKQYFVAEPPVKLEELARDRMDELKRADEKLARVIAELDSVYDGGSSREPVARMYEGPEGIKVILLDVLSSMEETKSKEYYVYSSSAVRDAGLYSAFPTYTAERLDARISVKNISLGKGGSTAGLDERKWIPATEGTPTYILIYAGKVANIFLDKKGELVGLIIDNKGIYETQKLLFASLWERL
ncbi:MAG: helix-turn-helix domain-containing protein [Patescibacteria group bacterium]|jgi:sugar-specific transcriptional regulator TrmB